MDKGAGTDSYTDFGFDFTYQYLANPTHIFELTATYLREHRDLKASYALGSAEKKHGSLDVFRTRAGYTYQQTYSINLGFLKVLEQKTILFIQQRILSVAVSVENPIARRSQRK